MTMVVAPQASAARCYEVAEHLRRRPYQSAINQDELDREENAGGSAGR
jgi:hypothetical protein